MKALQQPIAVITRTPGALDSDGNDGAPTETFVIVSGAFAPGPTGENLQGQAQVTSQPTAYLPFGTDITSIDAIVPNPVVDGLGVLEGTRYEVDGEPGSWQSGFGSTKFGVAVPLKEVTG